MVLCTLITNTSKAPYTYAGVHTDEVNYKFWRSARQVAEWNPWGEARKTCQHKGGWD
jgi:hypothetical protein